MSASALGLLFVALALPALAAEPRIPAPEGFVTDRAGVVPPATRARLVALLEELQQKTGAEIAVVTVPTTAPLDDFTYAMRIADAWKPGRKREDTGIVFLVAVEDRKLRILTGYGLEGILPDGLVGEIEDREIVPAFRAGRIDEGIWRGVAELARRIAAARGVELSGAPHHDLAPTGSAPMIDATSLVLLVAVLIFFGLVLAYGGGPRLMYGRRGGFYYGGFGGGFGGGGFGGGGGGFGGFGGGSFGGGGAGRSW
ncbi:MAG TPA: TPM domain-containing protein [Candidatus Limnocylindria bacterium]|nr:TPM domain-containing protein [Candidatus Limnocylindria bacterium]